MTEEKNYDELSFEQAMEKLEVIVNKLEEGDVPLEQAIEYYHDGMKLSKLCNEKLTNVQEKMVHILNEQGELEPFDVEEDK
ncbi:exodeoxyribonuclease VII small subunit [Oceanobacillus jeddahense]|uniref:Exodeoxyribonuclease 7 small subunit n=1 Tax=Oceanobacillus jeddahense TaxID=1462527 RepID=A0ABY5JQ62_9BACI|nr:exodeoxyribonuclease VII small subunit [Oceanobacillus jeddahense]UUI01298.1 exodeoxyribonuclease VII small subunit [Oceanobacillus jeddahense]